MKNAPPPIVNLLPENAPFTPEQRNWLNGFFAGLVSLEGGAAALARGSRRSHTGGAACSTR
jgi:sulfite reductase (NADPH) flavoprotein alpha-component